LLKILTRVQSPQKIYFIVSCVSENFANIQVRIQNLLVGGLLVGRSYKRANDEGSCTTRGPEGMLPRGNFDLADKRLNTDAHNPTNGLLR